MRDLEWLQRHLKAEWTVEAVLFPVLDFQPLVRRAVQEVEADLVRRGLTMGPPLRMTLRGLPVSYTERVVPEFRCRREVEGGEAEIRYLGVHGGETDEPAVKG